MNEKLRILPVVVLMTMAICAFTAIGDSPDEAAKQRKIDYIYVEAAKQASLDNSGTAFLLYDRVLDMDSNNTFAALNKGNYEIQTAKTQDVFENGLALLKKYYAAHPEDKQTSMYYGQVLSTQGYTDEALQVWANLDTVFPDEKEIKVYYANALVATLDSANIYKAISIYNTLEPEYGQEWATISKLKAYLTANDTTAAFAQTEDMVRRAGNDSKTYLIAGSVYQSLNRPDSALVQYKRACEADSTNGYAYYTLASYYLSQGDSTAYDREIFNALTKNSLEVDIKCEILRTYIANIYDIPEYQPKIRELFDKLVEIHPHEANIHFLYSQYLAYLNDYPKAAEQIEYAVDVDPTNHQWVYQHIAFNVFGDSLQKAINLGEEAMKNIPGDPDIMYITSIAYSQNKQYDKAEALAKSTVDTLLKAKRQDFNKISQLYTNIGDIYQQTEDNDSVIKYYDLAITYDPDNALALNNYAYALACQGKDLDKAEQMSAKAVQKDPESISSLDTYAWVFFKKQNYKLAKEYIDKVLAIDENPTAEIFHHAGDIYFMAGDPDEAVKFWEQALELTPNDELLKKKVTHKTYFYK